MQYFTYTTPLQRYKVAILVPEINAQKIKETYFNKGGITESNTIVCELYQDKTKKKTSASLIKEFINEELVPFLELYKVEYILCANPDYFKVFTKQTKAEPYLGYEMTSSFGSYKVFYIPNFKALFFNPEKVQNQIDYVLDSFKKSIDGNYQAPGSSIIHFEAYPKTLQEKREWLNRLIERNQPLTADIEAFSLKHYDAGIGTITFCWNEHEGIAFTVDNLKTKEPDQEVRKLLKSFFIRFSNKLIWHNISYDVYVLIYQLFMTDLLDTQGLHNGINILLRNFDDTKLITYLATNSCAGNQLGLKAQAQEYAGNYAQEEINDITKIPEDELLRYNLVDGLCTWYTYNKHYPTMVADQQKDIYENLFKPAIIDIIHMQLVGFPLNMERVKEVKALLEKDRNDALKIITNSSIIQSFVQIIKEQWVEKRNAKLKKKKVTIDDCNEEFNPNSNQQLQELLYDFLELPILEYTDSKEPATGKKVIESLINHTKDDSVIALLNALVDFKNVEKILTAFIPAFEQAQLAPDGWHYMFGSFNLGGTVSGRLSSSNPNLQNLPATGSKYAKVIKSCFQAPPGWLFVGLDFNALEDHISALLTKDSNKLKVYTDHYDGHCLRAFSYFKDKMPDIEQELAKEPERAVEIINSIKKRYPKLRQASKGPTFCLTYRGTFKALMDIFGFSKEEALHIESRYHELYKESDDWNNVKIARACHDGYVTAAFGLRVRTPLLKQVVLGTSRTPYEAEAEGRTAANALGQSWCLLNNRAGIEFNSLVRTSQYRYDIKPFGQIHDAQYFLVRDCPDAILFVNKYLVKAVQWQNDPAIQHDKVHLGGEVSIFFPDWSKELSIPNDVTTVVQLENIVSNYLEELK